jgi:sugar/nucleoside kinase (ribokinase family)
LDALGKRCNLDGVERLDHESLFFESKFDFDLQNRTALVLENSIFSKASWNIPDRLKNTDFLFLNTHTPAVDEKLRSQVGAKMVFMDTIEYLTLKQKPVLLEFLKKTQGFVLNDAEARILAGEANLVKAGKKIQSHGPEIVVIKKGEHGGLLFYGKEVFPFPAFPLEEVVDPTGAGDSFAGGFIGWLDKKKIVSEKTLREACVYGTVMASFCVESFGVDSLLTLTNEKIEGRLNEYTRLVGV